MKKIFLSIALIALNLASSAQTSKPKQSVKDTVTGVSIDKDGSILYQVKGRLVSRDSAGRITVKDSLKTIQLSAQSIRQAFAIMQDAQIKMQAAEEVLNYISINGIITDRPKFMEAVKKYQAAMSK